MNFITSFIGILFLLGNFRKGWVIYPMPWPFQSIFLLSFCLSNSGKGNSSFYKGCLQSKKWILTIAWSLTSHRYTLNRGIPIHFTSFPLHVALCLVRSKIWRTNLVMRQFLTFLPTVESVAISSWVICEAVQVGRCCYTRAYMVRFG